MKRTPIILTALSLLLLFFSSTVPAHAQQQLRGSNGNITQRGGALVYPVDLGAGHFIYATVYQAKNSKLNPYLRLYDFNKKLIWEDDDSAGGLNPYILFPTLLPGRYYLQVSGAGNTTGAFSILYGGFQPWGNTISNPRYCDVHTFYGRAGEAVWIQSFRPEGSRFDPYIDLIGPNGARSQFYDNRITNDSKDVLVLDMLLQTGSYRINLCSQDGSTGDYTLLFATFAP